MVLGALTYLSSMLPDGYQMGADDDLVQVAQKLVSAGYQAMFRPIRSVGLPTTSWWKAGSTFAHTTT